MFICYILLLPNEYTWNIGPHCMVSQLSWKVFNINMQKYISADSAELGEAIGFYKNPLWA